MFQKRCQYKVGDEVVFYGKQGEENIAVEEISGYARHNATQLIMYAR
ncbi:hypothetical protein ACT7DF_12300 [Bacillus cereus]